MHQSEDDIPQERRRLLLALLAGGATVPLTAAGCDDGGRDAPMGDRSNALLWAVAWKQTAAEYRALCHQAYNLARLRIDIALANKKPGDKPLAVSPG